MTTTLFKTKSCTCYYSFRFRSSYTLNEIIMFINYNYDNISIQVEGEVSNIPNPLLIYTLLFFY